MTCLCIRAWAGAGCALRGISTVRTRVASNLPYCMRQNSLTTSCSTRTPQASESMATRSSWP